MWKEMRKKYKILQKYKILYFLSLNHNIVIMGRYPLFFN